MSYVLLSLKEERASLTAAYKSAVPQEGLAVYSLRGGRVLYHLVEEEVQGKKCISIALKVSKGG